MAYVPANLSLESQAIAGPKTWAYFSADAVASVIGGDYFSDGDAKGMAVGDFVKIYDTNTGDGAVAFVTAVTAGGAASAAEYQAVTT